MKRCECPRRTDEDDPRFEVVRWSADCPRHGNDRESIIAGEWSEVKQS